MAAQVSQLFGLLLRGRQQRKRGGPTLVELLRETLRYTAFLGSFAGVFVAVDEGIASLFGKKRCCALILGI